ncbi:MAG: hypothetical protein ACI310_03660 [Bacilli bacterium]
MNKNKKIIVSVIIVLLIIIIGILLAVFLLPKDNSNNIDKINETLKSIEEGKKYTKDELIKLGLKEININDIDMNKNISNKINELVELETKNEYILEDSLGNKVLSIELNKSDVLLNYYDKEGKSVESQELHDIKTIKCHKASSLLGDEDIFLITNNNELLKLELRLNGIPERIYEENFEKILFKKIELKYKYIDIKYILNYGTTSGINYSYIGKTIDKELKYLDTENNYDINTYKQYNNVIIMNNRDIYLNKEIQSFKYKLGLESFVYNGKIEYILSKENYLYNSSLELQNNKKVSSILYSGINIVIIYEDGSNTLIEDVIKENIK